MRKYPLLTYLFPIILLLVAVALMRGSSEIKEEKPIAAEKEKPELVTLTSTDNDSEEGESQSEKKIQSRIPAYPNSQKAVLESGIDMTQAVFYSTDDPIDVVKNWYIEYLGGLTKVNMIDILDKNGLRKITISMSDPPKELVEIRERFKGAKGLMITITTIGFYTRTQPRKYEPKDIDNENDGVSSEDKPVNESTQKDKEK
ncbi:hypothetical protein J7L05_06120 [bacterium]|nr:hypothetical protein [bacterium]